MAGSILERLDAILTVIRLGLAHELRRPPAGTNIVENAARHGAPGHRQRQTLEAQKTFRRLKAYRQLPVLRNALQERVRKAQADSAIETIMKAA